MERNMDLIRQIAMAMTQGEDGWAPRPLRIEGYTATQIGFHQLLMLEGELVVGREITAFGGPPEAVASRLTWKGYEFLAAAKEPTRWEQAKALVTKGGGASFSVLVETLTKLALARIELVALSQP
jgi:hypothetical protein